MWTLIARSHCTQVVAAEQALAPARALPRDHGSPDSDKQHVDDILSDSVRSRGGARAGHLGPGVASPSPSLARRTPLQALPMALRRALVGLHEQEREARQAVVGDERRGIEALRRRYRAPAVTPVFRLSMDGDLGSPALALAGSRPGTTDNVLYTSAKSPITPQQATWQAILPAVQPPSPAPAPLPLTQEERDMLQLQGQVDLFELQLEERTERDACLFEHKKSWQEQVAGIGTRYSAERRTRPCTAVQHSTT